MEIKDKKKKSRKWSISNVLYIAASIIALAGVALLVDNIMIFRKAISEYVAQGYPIDTVTNQLIPSQLIPGVFEPVAVYGGIAFILFGIGKINKKVSRCLILLAKADTSNNTIKENSLEQNVVNVEAEAAK